MARHAIVLVVFAGAGIYILAPYVLNFLGNQIYSVKMMFLPILLVMAGLQGLSLVPHYGLYAMGRDRALIASHYGVFLLFIVSVALLSLTNRTLAVPIALCIGFFSMLLLKGALFTFYLRRKTAPRNHSRR